MNFTRLNYHNLLKTKVEIKKARTHYEGIIVAYNEKLVSVTVKITNVIKGKKKINDKISLKIADLHK